MKRYRIDFTVRELDVPKDQEIRGVSFGDDVSLDQIFDFFNRCRDAVVTLIIGKRPDSDVVKPDLPGNWNFSHQSNSNLTIYQPSTADNQIRSLFKS